MATTIRRTRKDIVMIVVLTAMALCAVAGYAAAAGLAAYAQRHWRRRGPGDDPPTTQDGYGLAG